jgi:hypothetical protein
MADGDGQTMFPTAQGSNTFNTAFVGGLPGDGLIIDFSTSSSQVVAVLYIGGVQIPLQFQTYVCNGAGPPIMTLYFNATGSPCTGLFIYTITYNP